jgi:hypothetical protein
MASDLDCAPHQLYNAQVYSEEGTSERVLKALIVLHFELGRRVLTDWDLRPIQISETCMASAVVKRANDLYTIRTLCRLKLAADYTLPATTVQSLGWLALDRFRPGRITRVELESAV